MKSKSNEIVNKILICIYCKSNFTINYLPIGRGSGNIVRKKYCSLKCKRKSITKTKICKNCIICNEIFYSYESNNRKTCSKKCCFIFIKKDVSRYCLRCNKIFFTKKSKSKKYCSYECYKITSNKKIKKKCYICDSEYIVKKSKINRKHCSKKCQYNAQSNGSIKIYTNGRMGYRKDIGDTFFKSSFEADYMRWCLFNNFKVLYENKTFEIIKDNKKCFYTPDFYHCDEEIYIELKGVKLCDNNFSKKINSNFEKFSFLEKNGIKIKIIYMNDFYNLLKITGQYFLIENLENRSYAKTKWIVYKN